VPRIYARVVAGSGGIRGINWQR